MYSLQLHGTKNKGGKKKGGGGGDKGRDSLERERVFWNACDCEECISYHLPFMTAVLCPFLMCLS